MIWGNGLTGAKLGKLQKFQNKCVKIIKPTKQKTLMTSQYKDLGILKISDVITLENMKLGYKYTNKDLPVRILELLTYDQNKQTLQKTHQYSTRNKNLPKKPNSAYKKYTDNFLCTWVNEYTNLPIENKKSRNIKIFASRCRKLLLK